MKKTVVHFGTPDFFSKFVEKQWGVECVTEHRFHPSRMWRFDYALPSLKIAIEIDGGVWKYGRHNRAAGYLGDLEKFNNAAALGWVVLKFTPDEKMSVKALELIGKTIENRQQ